LVLLSPASQHQADPVPEWRDKAVSSSTTQPSRRAWEVRPARVVVSYWVIQVRSATAISGRAPSPWRRLRSTPALSGLRADQGAVPDRRSLRIPL